MKNIILEIKSANKRFGEKEVFTNLNLSFEKEKITVIYGPSGCGKTTLLHCLALLKPLNDGKIFLEDKKILDKNITFNEKDVRKKIGIVFQDFLLWDNKKILDNLIEAPIIVNGLSKDEAVNKAKNICQKLSISFDLLSKYPPELSRGQRQRIAIARTLLMDPQILLLDEINASLDNKLTDQLVKIIFFLKKEKKTIILVTHDEDFGRSIGDAFIDFNKLD
jgi:polar amino acid transport system ATP-binding protein